MLMHTCVSLDELFQRDGHLLLHSAGVVHMTRDVEQFCTRVSLPAEAHKPRPSTATDGGCHRHRLHVGDSRRATKHTFNKRRKHSSCQEEPTGTYGCYALPELTNICRERRLETRLPLFSLQGLYEGGFFSTDVRTGATHHKHIEVVTRAAGVLSNQPSSIRLIDGHLKEKDGLILIHLLQRF